MFFLFYFLVLLVMWMEKKRIGTGMFSLGNSETILNGLVILFMVMAPSPSFANPKYEICPATDLTCSDSITAMANKVSKCNGLVICYESMLTNLAFDGIKYKINTLYKIRQGNAPRICQECIDDGHCKESSRGIKHQWNGFAVFYNGDAKALEVVIDIAGNQAYFTLQNVTPLQFLQALGTDKTKLDEIERISGSGAFWTTFSREGVRLEEVLGFEVLEVDFFLWNKHYALMDNKDERNVYIREKKFEQCQESSCSYFTEPSPFDKYSCHCGNHREEAKEINKCCETHHKCINALKNCTNAPNEYHFIKIDTSRYQIEHTQSDNSFKCLSKKNNKCQQAHCKCDRDVAQCWSKLGSQPESPFCLSCYWDDARVLALKPIDEVVNVQQNCELMDKDLTSLTKKIDKENVISEANATVILAVLMAQASLDITRNSEKEVSTILLKIENLMNEELKNVNTSFLENNYLKSRAYTHGAAYKDIMVHLISAQYMAEQIRAHDNIMKILSKSEKLEGIVLKKVNEELINKHN